MQLALLVPVFNEAAGLHQLTQEIESALVHIPGAYCVICDDGSTDTTASIMAELQQNRPWLMHSHNAGRLGKSRLLKQNIKTHAADLYLFMDGDLQQVPGDIPVMLEKFKHEQLDVLVGWRKERNDPPLKILASRIYNIITRSIFGTTLHDHDCGMLLISHAVLARILAEETPFDWHRFIVAMAAKLGYKVAEMPVTHRFRPHGASKYTLRRYVTYLTDIPKMQRTLRRLQYS